MGLAYYRSEVNLFFSFYSQRSIFPRNEALFPGELAGKSGLLNWPSRWGKGEDQVIGFLVREREDSVLWCYGAMVLWGI